MLKSLSDTLVAIVIEGGVHHLDLRWVGSNWRYLLAAVLHVQLHVLCYLPCLCYVGLVRFGAVDVTIYTALRGSRLEG